MDQYRPKDTQAVVEAALRLCNAWKNGPRVEEVVCERRLQEAVYRLLWNEGGEDPPGTGSEGQG